MHTTVAIGEFSRLTHLSVKALRHYHEIGLFEPADVDSTSGYRRYSTEQLDEAHLIRRLRDLAMPLPDIQTILASEERSERNRTIVDHLSRVEKELAETKEVVSSLRSLLADDAKLLDISIVRLPPLTVLTIGDTIEQQMILEWCGANFEPLYQKISEAGLVPTGAPGGLYSTEVLADGEGDVTIFVPVLGSPSQLEDAGAETLEAVQAAVATHEGPYGDLDTTYGQLGAEVNRLGISVSGPIRETYLVGPAHNQNPADWRTEVGWPVSEDSR